MKMMDNMEENPMKEETFSGLYIKNQREINFNII